MLTPKHVPKLSDTLTYADAPFMPKLSDTLSLMLTQRRARCAHRLEPLKLSATLSLMLTQNHRLKLGDALSPMLTHADARAHAEAK